MLLEITKELQDRADIEKAKILQRFFKTGKGEYGEGDKFLGIPVPKQREVAKKYWRDISFEEIQELLNSRIHENRQTGLMILVKKYKHSKKDKIGQRRIFEFYMKNLANINNWDLVDLSAPHIVGDFIKNEGGEILKILAKSKNLWERRIAIVSTMPLIKKRNFGETLAIANMLMDDDQDLIHKAVGWMLREVGKKNQEVLEIFLSTRHKNMPRTMLRYAIERFPQDKRKFYMNKGN